MQEQPPFSSFPQPQGTPDFTPAPNQAYPSSPASEQPQKPRAPKGLIITIILLAILLLGAIGFIVYMLYLQPKPVEEKKTETTTTATVDTGKKTGDADTLIAEIRTTLKEKITPTYKDVVFESGTDAPLYKAKGENFAVGGSFGFSLSVNPQPASYDEKANKAVQDAVIDSLGAKSRFTVTDIGWSKTYQDETTICSLSMDGAPISVRCANIADYKDTIAKAKPFAAAYLASEDGKKYGKDIALSYITVSQKTGGYSNATVSMNSTFSPIGGYAGLFYAKDTNWTYFKGTQALLNCTDYNTYDIQASFEGNPCYDTTTNAPATVKITLTK